MKSKSEKKNPWYWGHQVILFETGDFCFPLDVTCPETRDRGLSLAMTLQSWECQQLLDMLRVASCTVWYLCNWNPTHMVFEKKKLYMQSFYWNTISCLCNMAHCKHTHNGLSIIKVCGLSLNYNIALEVSQGGFEMLCLHLKTKGQGLGFIIQEWLMDCKSCRKLPEKRPSQETSIVFRFQLHESNFKD